jgi:hypothetical protein
MMKRSGAQSRAAQNGSADHDAVTNTLVVIGCTLSLGLVAVSAFLNFRMGYRSADSEIDGWAYGLAAGMGDGLKAIVPFVMYWGWKRRDPLAVIAAAAVFLVITGYSLTAALGFAELHRGAKQGERLGAIERHDDLRKEIGRTEARLTQLGLQRSEGEVDKAIATVLARVPGERGRTVDQISKGCTLNRADTRDACVEVAKLSEERERAREQARLETGLGDARKKLQSIDTTSIGASDDPQVEVMSRVATLMHLEPTKKDVQFGLSLLVALLVELGSGLGFYVSTTPWRGNGEGNEGSGDSGRRKEFRRRRASGWSWGRKEGEGDGVDGKGLGAVDLYAMDRLEPREQAEVSADELFDDYVVWCGWRGHVPYSKRIFLSQLADIGEEVGIPLKGAGEALVCLDVGLIGR